MRVGEIERWGRHRTGSSVEAKGGGGSSTGEVWMREGIRGRDTLRWVEFEKTLEKVKG